MCTYLIKEVQKHASIIYALTVTTAQLLCAVGLLDVRGNILDSTNSPVRRRQTFT